MLKVKDLRIGAELLCGEIKKRGEASEWPLYREDYDFNVESMVDHLKSEIITLNGYGGISEAPKEESKKAEFNDMITQIDNALAGGLGIGNKFTEMYWEAEAETIDAWFKMGLMIAMEIFKKKALIEKAESIKLTPEQLQELDAVSEILGKTV